jgi:hypothetical protein
VPFPEIKSDFELWAEPGFFEAAESIETLLVGQVKVVKVHDGLSGATAKHQGRLPIPLVQCAGDSSKHFREAAKAAFNGFVSGRTLNASQLEFIDMMIDHLTQHGVMDPGLLYESPFTDLNNLGVEGVFQQAEVQELVRILEDVERHAVA